ncbi:hypothetical protein CPB83DRAFT_832063 [Crepidotus variabilis]|uniref:Uncharacterized protein n=1 Tax=Crepidotus variabilis TaxID=179855 RepID=A0A9P6JVM5_9AGAR|nr:hypothetical protein CPB83DRAFT_832063 [Crepidotus variabilis]
MQSATFSRLLAYISVLMLATTTAKPLPRDGVFSSHNNQLATGREAQLKRHDQISPAQVSRRGGSNNCDCDPEEFDEADNYKDFKKAHKYEKADEDCDDEGSKSTHSKPFRHGGSQIVRQSKSESVQVIHPESVSQPPLQTNAQQSSTSARLPASFDTSLPIPDKSGSFQTDTSNLAEGVFPQSQQGSSTFSGAGLLTSANSDGNKEVSVESLAQGHVAPPLSSTSQATGSGAVSTGSDGPSQANTSLTSSVVGVSGSNNIGFAPPSGAVSQVGNSSGAGQGFASPVGNGLSQTQGSSGVSGSGSAFATGPNFLADALAQSQPPASPSTPGASGELEMPSSPSFGVTGNSGGIPTNLGALNPGLSNGAPSLNDISTGSGQADKLAIDTGGIPVEYVGDTASGLTSGQQGGSVSVLTSGDGLKDANSVADSVLNLGENVGSGEGPKGQQSSVSAFTSKGSLGSDVGNASPAFGSVLNEIPTEVFGGSGQLQNSVGAPTLGDHSGLNNVGSTSSFGLLSAIAGLSSTNPSTSGSITSGQQQGSALVSTPEGSSVLTNVTSPPGSTIGSIGANGQQQNSVSALSSLNNGGLTFPSTAGLQQGSSLTSTKGSSGLGFGNSGSTPVSFSGQQPQGSVSTFATGNGSGPVSNLGNSSIGSTSGTITSGTQNGQQQSSVSAAGGLSQGNGLISASAQKA